MPLLICFSYSASDQPRMFSERSESRNSGSELRQKVDYFDEQATYTRKSLHEMMPLFRGAGPKLVDLRGTHAGFPVWMQLFKRNISPI